ncbi:unnamed protein product [Closterium sp. NIES-54]
MCIDYRALNAATVKNRFLVPRVDDLLDAVQGTRVFSEIDLRSIYHQIRVVPEDQDMTEFHTKQGLYEFWFDQCPNDVTLFFASGITTDPKKITAVHDWVAPTSVKELQSFLGFANYYHHFVQGYASIAIPLTDLLRKGVDFDWGPAQQQAFEQMKQTLTSSPTLSYPDPTRPYVVVTDASYRAIEAVLLQDQGRGLQPIAYESRKLRGAELNYPIHDKEALTIIHAYKVWRCYLEGADSVVRTDH